MVPSSSISLRSSVAMSSTSMIFGAVHGGLLVHGHEGRGDEFLLDPRQAAEVRPRWPRPSRRDSWSTRHPAHRRPSEADACSRVAWLVSPIGCCLTAWIRCARTRIGSATGASGGPPRRPTGIRRCILDEGSGASSRNWRARRTPTLVGYRVALSAFAASISSAVISPATESRMNRAFGLLFSTARLSQA